MPYLFSPGHLTFYHTEVPYPDIPADVREVTDEEHDLLMQGLLTQGKVLQSDAQGAPVLVDRTEAASTVSEAAAISPDS
ncbi:hypothetical protein [Pseudomonas juntendi]|uniref:Uncharacterized protein n=1 Tax=Pseudomonas juntendi TaxID=2666183 RepID=A0AAJ5UW17_9PSED|nr:hypothetical protein [Pseudomonas juntendi]WEA18948.1 hypothetical protein PWA60_16770 [Pseudomonas juntendi]